jgi:hypothetical protein
MQGAERVETSITLALRRPHADVFLCDKRFIVLVAGRRWGKTMLAVWCLIVNAFSHRNRICYYIAPTYGQAKRIAWSVLKELVPSRARRRTSEQELLIELPNNSIIQLLGADRPDRLRGVGLDYAVLDEYANMRPEIWSAVIRPALSNRAGRALFIGTPRGRNHFYDLYCSAKFRPNWATFLCSTKQDGYVPPDELAALACEMDPQLYLQEFCASFEETQSRVYHSFDLEKNVFELAISSYAPLLIGMDFNVNPMTAVVGQRAADQCHIIDEIVLPNSNTQEMMNEINRRYEGRHGIVHPDPSGVARKTSAPVGLTDFAVIEQAGWLVYRATGYPLVDRINTVNARLCNAQGQRRLLISRHCTQLIGALDCLTYKEGTKIPDKRSGLDHIADAVGYLVMGLYPVITDTVSIQTVRI